MTKITISQMSIGSLITPEVFCGMLERRVANIYGHSKAGKKRIGGLEYKGDWTGGGLRNRTVHRWVPLLLDVGIPAERIEIYIDQLARAQKIITTIDNIIETKAVERKEKVQNLTSPFKREYENMAIYRSDEYRDREMEYDEVRGLFGDYEVTYRRLTRENFIEKLEKKLSDIVMEHSQAIDVKYTDRIEFTKRRISLFRKLLDETRQTPYVDRPKFVPAKIQYEPKTLTIDQWEAYKEEHLNPERTNGK